MKIMHVPRASVVCFGLCFSFGGVATGCMTGSDAEPNEGIVTSAINIDVNAAYTIVGVQSNKCVGVVGASTSPEARLDIETCTGTASQRFRPADAGGGFFFLRNELSGLCMDVNHNRQNQGEAVIQFDCHDALNQQWSFTDVAGGAERITVRHSGQVLDVTNAGTADGTLLEQWPSNGGTNQRFRLVAAVAPIAPE